MNSSSTAPPLLLRMIPELHRLAERRLGVSVCLKLPPTPSIHYKIWGRDVFYPLKIRPPFHTDFIPTAAPEHTTDILAVLGSKLPENTAKKQENKPLFNPDRSISEDFRAKASNRPEEGMAEHLSQSELDYPFKLLEYFNGFRVSKVIFSACELGVFDLLLRSQEPLSAQHVARELSTSVDGMERLLDALVGIEILEVETTDGTALYSSTDVANLYLAKGSAKSLHDMIIYQSQTIYPLWNNMVDAVREGKNQNQKTFGLPPEDVFQAIYRSEEEMLKFMGLMNSLWVLDGHDIVTAFNLSCFQHIVDLGGCTGALAREMAKAYPSSSVSVLDLPQVVETAQKHFSQENDAVAFQSGDFFSGDIPPADLYVLARVIHDWPEEKCLMLLKKIYDTCKPGGGVLLVEAMLFENRRGPVMAQIFSLNMLVQAEGRERPPSAYTRLLHQTGFRNVQVCRTGKSYDAILAIR